MIPDNIEAYIFDLDGTLIDSNGVWKEIDRLIFEKNNVCLSDSELNAAAAMNYSDFLGFLRSYGIAYTLDELKSELDGYAVIKYSSEIRLKNGVKEYLDKLKKAGKKIFLATASPEKLYAPVLKNNGVYGYFDGFVTTEEAGAEKDCPDIYLLAAKKCAAEPHNCAVFEDILSGIKSAKSVGMFAVGVYDSCSADEADSIKNAADMYIMDFKELL